ncbi:hypothetical protein ACFZB5_13695 [Streptomyces nodosus]|uniref:hypothetical protein n=1 Tax=Streptomyces nodosus TaxID=40318 RepID=UPI0036E294E8
MPTTADALLALADQLDQRPNQPAHLPSIRGRARYLGLTSDWVDLLPPTDGAAHSQYAARLRALAGGH